MQPDPARQSGAENYQLLTNLVVPRPIAWITSVGPAGVVNLAPFPFFNAVGASPVYLVVRIGRRTGDRFDKRRVSFEELRGARE